MELLLALASLKCFELESASKLKESSLVRQIDKSINLFETTNISQEEQGQQKASSTMTVQDEASESAAKQPPADENQESNTN